MRSVEIPFEVRDVPEIFASRVVRVEITSDGMVRFYLASEENGALVLGLKLVIPLIGAMAHRGLIEAALGRNDYDERIQTAAH